MEDYSYSDLVNIEEFSRLLHNFYEATGIPNGLVGRDGELLSQAGWVSACADFHRLHPLSAENCKESNLDLMRYLNDGEVACSLCKNGLIDYATPVMIEGRPLATLFLGQVLNEPPDIDYFRKQARHYGYDTGTYLKAIDAVPVVSKERMESLMACMVGMSQMLVASGLARLKQEALEQDLSRSTERRIQLEDILDSSPVGIGWSDVDGNLEYINEQFTHLFGYTLEDLPDLETWYRRAYPDNNYWKTVVEPWYKQLDEARVSNTPVSVLEAAVCCADGSEKRVLVRATWVGRKRLINFSDITAHWLSERRNHTHDAMLEMVARGESLSNILHAIVETVETEEPSALCSILLLDEEGRHLHTGAAPSLPSAYNQAIDGVEIGMGVGSCGTAAWLGERVIVEDIMTHEYWQPYRGLAEIAGVAACWSDPIVNTDGKVLGTFAIYHRTVAKPTTADIERISFAANLAAIAIENQNARTELEHRAYFDFLTKLSNRRHFIELAENELSRFDRYQGGLSLLMFDVDHFKQVNDQHGHNVGDQVLRMIGDVCRDILRSVDIIGRIGGEEFAALLPQTPVDPAMMVAERLRLAIHQAKIPLADGGTLSVTASFGVVEIDGECLDLDKLLNSADQALYKAKAEGRDRVCLMGANQIINCPEKIVIRRSSS